MSRFSHMATPAGILLILAAVVAAIAAPHSGADPEAQRLILAVYEGTIHMVLRSREDINGIHVLTATTDWDLMGMEPPEPADDETPDPTTTQQMMTWPPGLMGPVTAPAPAAPAAPAAPTIEVIRGREHTTVTTDQ